jgi:hypothetical protein
MKLALTLCIILFAFVSKAQTVTDSFSVIFPAEKILQLQERAAYTRFTPTIADINTADSIAAAYILLNKEQYKWTKPYKNYFKQYAGLVADGKLIIFINAMHKKQDCFLQYICDAKGGGTGFFKIKIDINKKELMQLRINAPK